MMVNFRDQAGRSFLFAFAAAVLVLGILLILNLIIDFVIVFIVITVLTSIFGYKYQLKETHKTLHHFILSVIISLPAAVLGLNFATNLILTAVYLLFMTFTVVFLSDFVLAAIYGD